MRKKGSSTDSHRPSQVLWVLFYGALAALAFAPCLFFGQAYFDNDLLAQFGPWRAFLKDQLAQGHFPLWNPYLLGGQPFLADLQSMMLYPPNYLTLPFSVPYGLSLFFFLHMIWAAWGMDLWLGTLGLSGAARRIGALLFAFSGFFWLEIIHPPVLAAFAWLPWLFYQAELLAKDLKPKNAFGTGLCFALLFLAGSFQVSLGAFYSVLGYFLFRRNWPEEKDRRRLKTKKVLLTCSLLAWGCLPLLAQLIPTSQYSKLTDRGQEQSYDQTRSDLSLTPAKLYQFFLPRLTAPTDRSMAEAVQMEDREKGAPLIANWGFLGIWTPFFMAWAFRGRNKWTLLSLLLMALGSLFISFGPAMPFYHLLWKVLPGFSTIRVPFRYLFLYVLAACPLVMMGWERWMAEGQGKNWTLKTLAYPMAYAAVCGAVALFRPAECWRELVGLGLGLSAILLPPLTGSKTRTLALILWGIALAFPLLLSGWDDFRPAPSSNFDYADNSGGLLEARQALGSNRVIFFNTEMHYPIQVGGEKYILAYPQNASCALGLKNFGGYNPLLLKAKQDIGNLPIRTLIHLGAIQGVLTQKIHENMTDFNPKVFRSFFLYEYKEPLHYIFAPEKLELIENPDQRLARMRQADYDPYQETILSKPLPPNVNLSPIPAHIHYEIKEDKADEQAFTLWVDQDCLALFTETMFPGWKAWLDGNPTPLYTADHLLRSLVVPAGRHEVLFRFEPSWKRPILWGLWAWAFLTLAGYWTGRKTFLA